MLTSRCMAASGCCCRSVNSCSSEDHDLFQDGAVTLYPAADVDGTSVALTRAGGSWLLTHSTPGDINSKYDIISNKKCNFKNKITVGEGYNFLRHCITALSYITVIYIYTVKLTSGLITFCHYGAKANCIPVFIKEQSAYW